MTQAAVCDLVLENQKDKCGVASIGRCHRCQKAFCTSHQGYTIRGGNGLWEGQPLPNECLSCTETAKAEYVEYQQLGRSYGPALYKRIAIVAKAMVEAKVPGLVNRRKKKGYETKKKGLFRKQEFVDIWEELEPAWPVGAYNWDSGYDNSGVHVKGFLHIGVSISGLIVVMGNDTDNEVFIDAHFAPPPDEWGNYDKKLLGGTEAIDQIREALEVIAKRHKVKLDTWNWPPVGDATTSKEYPYGKVFDGIVKSILPYGASVEFLPGREGMLPDSKMKKAGVKRPSEVVSVGQKVKVKVLFPDEQGGVILSMIHD